MDFIQMMVYLTDVHEGTYCFSICPESVDDEFLEAAEAERRSIVDFCGPPGTVVLFNVSALHRGSARDTGKKDEPSVLRALRSTVSQQLQHDSGILIGGLSRSQGAILLRMFQPEDEAIPGYPRLGWVATGLAGSSSF